MEDLLAYALNRLAGVCLIVELLIMALNEVPDTPEKWRKKKRNAFRRLCYFLALCVAVTWLFTL